MEEVSEIVLKKQATILRKEGRHMFFVAPKEDEKYYECTLAIMYTYSCSHTKLIQRLYNNHNHHKATGKSNLISASLRSTMLEEDQVTQEPQDRVLQ